MVSSEMKHHVLMWMKYEKNFLCMATEYLNGSDVFGVNRNNYATEVEVKVSWADFMSEMKTIKYLLDPENDNQYPLFQTRKGNVAHLHKFNKHRSYLIEESKWEERPKYFYFAVPLSLAAEALKELSGPYGLILVQNDGMYWERVSVIKDAKPLTNKKFDNFRSFCQKVSNENISLRDRLRMSGRVLEKEVHEPGND